MNKVGLDTLINGAYIGTDKVDAIYLGSERVYPWSSITITSVVCLDIPAKGGDVSSATVHYKYDDGNGEKSDSKTVTFTNVHAASLQALTKDRTEIAKRKVTITEGGLTSAEYEFAVYQEANKIEESVDKDYSGSLSIGAGITAAQSSATVTFNAWHTHTDTYTSGSTQDITIYDACTVSVSGTRFSGSGSKTASSGNATFTLSHSSMGTTVTTDTATVSLYNSSYSTSTAVKTATKSVSNSITAYTPSFKTSPSWSDIAASGAANSLTTNPVITITRKYTTGDTNTLADTTYSTTTYGTWSFSGTGSGSPNGFSFSGSTAKAFSLGKTTANRTARGSATCTFTLSKDYGGASVTSSAVNIYQAANSAGSWGVLVLTNPAWNNITAGGAKGDLSTNMSVRIKRTWTSGSEDFYDTTYPSTTYGSWSFSKNNGSSPKGFSIDSSGNCTASSLGTTSTSAMVRGTATCKFTASSTYSSVSVTSSAINVTQSANTAGSWSSSFVTKPTWGDIGANGGGAALSNTPKVKVSRVWSSGSTESYETNYASTTYGSWSFSSTSSGNPNGFSYSSSTGLCTANSLGTTIASRTHRGTMKLTFTANSSYGSGAVSSSVDVYQSANAFVSYSYDAPYGRTYSCSDIPASGGTISSGTAGGTIYQTRRYNYTAGNDLYRDTLTNPTVEDSGVSGSVSGSHLGKTETLKTYKGQIYYWYKCNGQTTGFNVKIYQQANTKSTSYGVSISQFRYGNVPSTANVSVSPFLMYGIVETETWTSGSSSSQNIEGNAGVSPTKSFSTTSTLINLDTSEGFVSAKSDNSSPLDLELGSVKVTLSYGGSSANKSAIVYQSKTSTSAKLIKAEVVKEPVMEGTLPLYSIVVYNHNVGDVSVTYTIVYSRGVKQFTLTGSAIINARGSVAVLEHSPVKPTIVSAIFSLN